MGAGWRRRLRSALGWLPAVLLVSAGMALAAGLGSPTDQEAATRTLYPLDAGTTWRYAVSDHGTPSGTHTRQVTGRGVLFSTEGVAVNGTAHLLDTYTDYPGQGARTTGFYLASNGDHIDQYGVISPTHDYEALDPPAKVYEVADVGSSWSYQGTFDLDDFAFTTEVSDSGPVRVGGHTFEDCSETTTTIPVHREGERDSEEVVEEWTCPGYGPVSSSDRWDAGGFLVTEELVAFHGLAGNWSAADQPAGSAQPPLQPVTSLGFDEARTNAVDGRLDPQLAWTVGRDTSRRVGSVAAGSLQVTGDDGGWVTALDVATGEQAWQVRLTAPVLTSPAIAGDTVLVAGGEKRLWALSLADGSTRWVRDLDDVVTTTPSVVGSTVVVATDDGKLTALDAVDGSQRWSTSLAGRLASASAVDQDRVYVCDQAGNVTALDLSDGRAVWSRTVSEGALLGPSVADGLVLVQDGDGIVYAFHDDSGTLEWESRTRGASSAPLAVRDDTVVVLLDSRRLDAVDLSDGHRLWSRPVPLTDVAPVVVGEEVVSVSLRGQVDVLGLDDGHPVDGFDLPQPRPGLETSVSVPLSLTGGALVVTSDFGDDLTTSTTYAYPVDGGQDDGVLLDVTDRAIPSVPTEPVTELDDGDVLLAGSDGHLSNVDPSGQTRTLLTNQERIATGGVPADDLVVSRRDDRLEALPHDGGQPVWSLEAGPAYAGSLPAVSGGTVYAGTSDGRLLAVALTDGTVRWSAPVDETTLPQSPLVLAGGDVVYGVGLARYDGATGRRAWSVPGAISVGRPVEASGSVVAAVTNADGSAGLGAWDTRTGEQQWLLPGTPEPYLGPAVAEGRVVWVDADGTVQAVDAGTGEPVWTLPLHRPAAGVPVIRDGRVYLAASGRAEDLEERDFRVLVLDLASGRFLGSWDPPATQSWIVPAVGAGVVQPLLVPTSSTRSLLVAVGPHG